MEGASTSETSAYFYQTTRRNKAEDGHLHCVRSPTNTLVLRVTFYDEFSIHQTFCFSYARLILLSSLQLQLKNVSQVLKITATLATVATPKLLLAVAIDMKKHLKISEYLRCVFTKHLKSHFRTDGT
jgi:hypothetical protein